MTIRLSVVALTAAWVLCSGCALLSSTRLEPKPNASAFSSTAGYYFLPKIKYYMTAERKLPVPVSQEVTEAKNSANKSTGSETTSSRTLKFTTVEPPAATPDCTITLGTPVTEPDFAQLFSLNHIRTAYAEDKIDITLTPSGLLTKVKISAEDKIPAFVQKLAEFAKEAVVAAAAVGGAGLKDAKDGGLFRYVFLIDPTNDDDLKAVNDSLKEVKCHLEVSLDPIPIINYTPEDKKFTENRQAIFYRPALPYKLTFRSTQSPIREEIQAALSLPNKAPVMALDLERVSFGIYTNEISFENGMLKQVNLTVPSSALGFMSIPIDIAKAIASIPGEILKVKLDLSSKETGLIDAQKKMLESEEILRQYIEELRKKKNEEGSTKSAGK